MKHKYFYGYNIVAAGASIQAMCIGAMFTYGVFFKEFEAVFGWSRALVSGASSLAFFVMGAGGILAGSLNDRIGPRLILSVSGISMGIGYMLMSQLSAPWQLYLFYGLLAGIGLSTHDVITLSTVARWFTKRRGMMTGIVKVGTGSHGTLFGTILFSGTIGGSVGPLLTGYLFDVTGSYRIAFLLLTALSVTGFLLIVFLRPPKPTNAIQNFTPN